MSSRIQDLEKGGRRRIERIRKNDRFYMAPGLAKIREIPPSLIYHINRNVIMGSQK